MKCKYCGCELAVVGKVPNISFSETKHYVEGDHSDICPMNWSNIRLGYATEEKARESVLGISKCKKDLKEV